MSDLGQRIRQARLARGVTGAQLAELIGVSANYISELERGIKRNPSMQVISGMSDVLQFPVDYFFGAEKSQLGQYIPSDLAGFVQEAIVTPYGAASKNLDEMNDREVMEAFVGYLRSKKQRDDENKPKQSQN